MSGQVTGRKADAVLAAHLASEAALRLVKPGNESYEVTDTVSKIAEAFKCKVKNITTRCTSIDIHFLYKLKNPFNMLFNRQ